MEIKELEIKDSNNIDLHIQKNKNTYFHPKFNKEVFNTSYIRNTLFEYQNIYYSANEKSNEITNLLCIQIPNEHINSKKVIIVLITEFKDERFLNLCINKFKSDYPEYNKISIVCSKSSKHSKIIDKTKFIKEVEYLNNLNAYAIDLWRNSNE